MNLTPFACVIHSSIAMKIGWQFPPFYWLFNQSSFIKEEELCFEKVLVPGNSFQHFTSQQAANAHRDAALRMCNTPERDPAQIEKKIAEGIRPNVMFLQRGFDRQMINAEELCRGEWISFC